MSFSDLLSVLSLGALFIGFIAAIVVVSLGLLMPFYVYRMKSQMDELEQSIKEIKSELSVLVEITTHINKGITNNKEK